MSTNHHNPLTGVIANLYSTLNGIFSSLDSAITTNASDIATNTADIATNTADIVALQAGGSGGGTTVPGTMQGRLTLSSSDAVPTSDVTGATTLYLLPYNGELVALYNTTGGEWEYHNLPAAGVSSAIPASTDTNYDVFLYDSSGTLTLEFVAWTDDTTRATALATQDGVYVKTGALDRLYVGTIRTTGVSGECEDSGAFRYVWNAYNRVSRRLLKQFSGSHTLTATSYRAWNNDPSNSVSVVLGLATENIRVQLVSLGTGTSTFFSIGLNSSTVASSVITPGADVAAPIFAVYNDVPGAGQHALIALERVNTGTGTIFGASAAGSQYGMEGSVFA